MNKIRVSVVGASGYTGLELVKILLRHPHVEITNLAVRSDIGTSFSELFPALKGRCDLKCSAIDVSKIADESDVIFFGLPHKTSMDIIPKFLDFSKNIIDL
ncbi:N-acetyl-gamma-glutamyl-phosphate reductase, partial [bacterium]|nr:N-acetyl-gamma-glutamyl-phosphate reductase [bacterium]